MKTLVVVLLVGLAVVGSVVTTAAANPQDQFSWAREWVEVIGGDFPGWQACEGEELDICARWNTYKDGPGTPVRMLNKVCKMTGAYVDPISGSELYGIPVGVWEVRGIEVRPCEFPVATPTATRTATVTARPTVTTSTPTSTATATSQPTATLTATRTAQLTSTRTTVPTLTATVTATSRPRIVLVWLPVVLNLYPHRIPPPPTSCPSTLWLKDNVGGQREMWSRVSGGGCGWLYSSYTPLSLGIPSGAFITGWDDMLKISFRIDGPSTTTTRFTTGTLWFERFGSDS